MEKKMTETEFYLKNFTIKEIQEALEKVQPEKIVDNLLVLCELINKEKENLDAYPQMEGVHQISIEKFLEEETK